MIKEDKKKLNNMLYFLVGFILVIALVLAFFSEKDYCDLTLRIMQQSDDAKYNKLVRCDINFPSLAKGARCLCYNEGESNWSMSFG